MIIDLHQLSPYKSSSLRSNIDHSHTHEKQECDNLGKSRLRRIYQHQPARGIIKYVWYGEIRGAP